MPDQTESRKTPRGFWKKLLLAGLFIFGLLVLLAWICLFRNVPIEISKETTYITEPLTSDGKRVDYFRAIEQDLYPPEMKTDENGFRRIIREIGVSSESASPAWIAPQIYEKLGLDPSVAPTMTFQDPHMFLKEYVEHQTATSEPEEIEGEKAAFGSPPDYEQQQELIRNLERPWTLDEMPMMADWLKDNSAALDILAEAVTYPSFTIPFVRENENELIIAMLLTETHRLREFTRGLQARANHRIAIGKLDRAIDDILACKRLGRHTTNNHGLMVNYLTGIAIEGIANDIGIAGSLDHQPTEAQLQRLLDIYVNTKDKKLPDRADPKKTFGHERYTVLDAAQGAVHESDSFFDTISKFINGSDSHLALQLLSRSGIDGNIVMERVNYLYDHPEIIRTLDLDKSLSLNLLLPARRSEFMGNAVACFLIPETKTFFEAVHRAKCYDRLKAITLAMLIYEKQHETLPPAWTVDKDGKPLHSWRVLLLPYLGEEAKKLYQKIRLDEPWDSEHNRQFHQAAISFYQCPSAELKPGETAYTVVLGKKTAFRGSEGVKLDTFGPNSVNMILVTERKTPICWMDPSSEVPETDASTEIGSEHEGSVQMGLRSGATMTLSDEIVEGTYVPIDEEKPDPMLFQKLLEGTADDWN